MAVLKHRVLKKKKYIYNNVNFNFLFLYNFNNNVKLIKLINNCYNFLNINKTYFEFFKKTIISVEVKNNYIIKNFKNNINSFLLENKYKNTYNFLLNNYKYCNIYFKQNYNLKKKHIQYFIIKTLLFKFNTNLIKYFITLKFNIIYKLPINNNKFGVLSNNFFIFKRLIKSRLFFIKNIKNIKKYKQLFKLKYRNKITNKINKNKIMKFKSKILKKIFKIFKIFKLSIVFNVNDDLLIYNRKTIKQFNRCYKNRKYVRFVKNNRLLKGLLKTKTFNYIKNNIISLNFFKKKLKKTCNSFFKNNLIFYTKLLNNFFFFFNFFFKLIKKINNNLLFNNLKLKLKRSDNIYNYKLINDNNTLDFDQTTLLDNCDGFLLIEDMFTFSIKNNYKIQYYL